VQSTPPELLPKRADAAYIPYNLIDRVITATKGEPEASDKDLQAKVEKLREDLKRRIDGLTRIKLA